MTPAVVVRECRSCGSQRLATVFELGEIPIANALLDSPDAAAPRFPLTLVFCGDCSLVQLREKVPASALFGPDYPYYSSYADTLLRHSRRHIRGLVEELGLGGGDLVLEVASNDGYLLRYAVEEGLGVLGIDPSPGPAAVAEEAGIPTLVEYFGTELASRLVSQGVRPSVVIANNVLAHVADQNDFVAGLAAVLGDAVVEIEVPYVADLLDEGAFDTIYHEHHCYFSVTSLQRLFRRHGLTLIQVTHLSIHGGSLRCRMSRGGEPDPSVGRFLAAEANSGLDTVTPYLGLANRAMRLRDELRSLLAELHVAGDTVAGYGAAAKATVMANYLGLTIDDVSYIVDLNPEKQGKYLPGPAIPIVGPGHLVSDPPAELLLFAWNLADEVMAQQQAFASGGGRFIVPIPGLHRI